MPTNPQAEVTFADIVQAQYRIRPYLPPTLLEHAPELGDAVYLKLENTNRTHSFKIRGALNAVLSLSDQQKARGIIAASSGNHAQGLACAAQIAGSTAQILMPQHTPQKKIQGVKRYGSVPILFGQTYDEAEAEALQRARQDGLTYISPYNDAAIIAGAGTTGLEIVESLPDVARVIVCVSGGGLIAGVAQAIRTLEPDCEIIGVNARSAPAMYNIFYDTDYPQVWDTLAEALSGDIETGSITVPMTLDLVDEIVLVTEEQIAEAMRWCLTTAGWLVEGGGAVGVAAVLSGVIELDERPTVIIVSGGNVDLSNLQMILTSDLG